MASIERIREIAETSGCTDLAERATAIEAAEENHEYIVSFMGQFSAGKSRLINCLLERELLPVHIEETTAAVTFISYGDEYAELRLDNGSVRNIALSDIKELWQKGSLPEGIYISEVKRIDIFINSDILKNGLVIADTPGTNTLHKRHEALTIDTINRTEEVVYVMGKPLTESDALFIEGLYKNGIPLSIVRTHMDKLNSSEENPEETISAEKARIKEIVPDVMVSFVSAEPYSSFYEGLNSLRSYLGNTIAENISVRLKESTESRAEVLRKQLILELDEQLENLKKRANNENMDYENKLNMLSDKKRLVEDRAERRREHIRQGFKEAKTEAEHDMKEKCKQILSSFRNEVDEKEMTPNWQTDLEATAQRRVKKAYDELKKTYTMPFNVFMKSNTDELMQEISSEGIDLSDMPVPESVEMIIDQKIKNDSMLNQLQEQIDDVNTLISTIEKKRYELQLSEEELKTLSIEIAEAKQLIAEEREELGPYVPQYYIDDSDVKGTGDKMRVFGKVLDWATLLIPGSAYEKVAAKLGQTIAKSGKLLSTIGKAAKKADTVKDVSYALKNISKTYKTAKRTQQIMNTAGHVRDVVKDTPELFDLLSFEYWMGKIGDHFDGKPVELEDLHYKNEYNRMKSELERKVNEQVSKEIELCEKTGLIKSDKDRLERESEAKIRYRANAEKDLESRKVEIRDKAKKEAFIDYKGKFIIWFDDRLQKVAENISDTMSQITEPLRIQYEEECTTGILDELDRLSEEYERMARCFKNLSGNELNTKLAEYESMISELGA